MKRHITDEADARLAFFLPIPQDAVPPGVEVPPRPQLPAGVVDTPLVRVFNFLRMYFVVPSRQMLISHLRNDVIILSARDIVVSSVL